MIIKNTLFQIAVFMFINAGLSFASTVDKDDHKNPLGCRDLGYEYHLKLLKLHPEAAGRRQSMYFVYNKAPSRVSLYHLRDGDGVQGTHLNHIIDSKRWAVFSTSEKLVKFTCTLPSSGSKYGKIVDCSNVLQVCEYDNVKFGMNNKGNLWIVNSNTRNGAVREVVRYGIIPAQ